MRFANRRAGWIAALVCISTPWMAYVSTRGLIDGVVACYFWLAVYAWLMYRRDFRKAKTSGTALGWLMASGFLAGSAVACKYPAAAFVEMGLAAARDREA